MRHEIRWIVAVTLALWLGAPTASATEEERAVEEWIQEAWEGQDEGAPQDDQPKDDGNRDRQPKNDRNGDHDRQPKIDRNGDHNRQRDGHDRLLQVPGGSADQRARDALDSGHSQPAVPWVDTGPATNVDGQIQAIDQLLGTQEPAIVDGGDDFSSGGDVMKGAFSDTDGTDWNYCAGKCKKKTKKHRGSGGVYYSTTVTRGTCAKDCTCVLFKTTGGQLVNKLEVDYADENDDGVDDGSGYVNIGTDNGRTDWSVRCCEED